MTVKVTFNEDATRSLYEQLASSIELVDQSLRKSLSGFDVEAVVPEVRRSFAEIGFDLTRLQLQDYARSISERKDYEFVLE